MDLLPSYFANHGKWIPKFLHLNWLHIEIWAVTCDSTLYCSLLLLLVRSGPRSFSRSWYCVSFPNLYKSLPFTIVFTFFALKQLQIHASLRGTLLATTSIVNVIVLCVPWNFVFFNLSYCSENLIIFEASNWCHAHNGHLLPTFFLSQDHQN